MHLQSRTQLYLRALQVAQCEAPACLVGVFFKQIMGQQADADGRLELPVVLTRLQLSGQAARHAVDIALAPMQKAPQLHFYGQSLTLLVFRQNVEHNVFSLQIGRQDVRIQDALDRYGRRGMQHGVDQVREQGQMRREQHLEDQVVAER